MGRKQSWCGKHLYFYLAGCVNVIFTLLALSCGSSLWADIVEGNKESYWQAIEQCVDGQKSSGLAKEALQCLTELKTKWPDGRPELKAITLLEQQLAINSDLETELNEKKEIIRILIEQIERIKLVDIEMEKQRQGTQP